MNIYVSYTHIPHSCGRYIPIMHRHGMNSCCSLRLALVRVPTLFLLISKKTDGSPGGNKEDKLFICCIFFFFFFGFHLFRGGRGGG